jgi:hypothetical protein
MLNNDPVRTSATDRWRVTFSEELPQGSWRDKFLAKARATSEGRETPSGGDGARSATGQSSSRTRCPSDAPSWRVSRESAVKSRRGLILLASLTCFLALTTSADVGRCGAKGK